MRTQSIDTSPEFEQIQITHLRTFSAIKKFESTRSWTQSIASASFHFSPGLVNEDLKRERAVAFVAREYGDHFAHLFCAMLEKQPEWQIQPPDIQEALLPILNAIERLDVPALFIGSVADSIYGFPRLVHDIDLLVDLQSKQVASLYADLGQDYVFDSQAIADTQHNHTVFSLLHMTRLVKVDIILPSTIYEKSVVARRQAKWIIKEREQLSIASPEDVVLLSLIHYQNQGNNADDQWNDIIGVLKVQAPILDLEYLDRQAKAMNIKRLLLQAYIDAGIYDDTPSSSQEDAFITQKHVS